MKLTTDLNKIKKISEQNNRENWNFRAFLKGYDATIEEMDSIVHELYQRISSAIDCTKCANCCKIVQPVLDREDIKKCCEGFGISVSQFIRTAPKIVNHFLIFIRKNLFSDYGASWRPVLFARSFLMSMSNLKGNSGIPAMIGLQITMEIFFIDT